MAKLIIGISFKIRGRSPIQFSKSTDKLVMTIDRNFSRADTKQNITEKSKRNTI